MEDLDPDDNIGDVFVTTFENVAKYNCKIMGKVSDFLKTTNKIHYQNDISYSELYGTLYDLYDWALVTSKKDLHEIPLNDRFNYGFKQDLAKEQKYKIRNMLNKLEALSHPNEDCL
jgi:hypothetical protein